MDDGLGVVFGVVFFMTALYLLVMAIIKVVSMVFGFLVLLVVNLWWVPLLALAMYVVARLIYELVIDQLVYAMEEASIRTSTARVKRELRDDFNQTRDAMRRAARGAA
jgi:hypothetical protein